MTLSDSGFSDGLFAVALSPERLYNFASTFVDWGQTPEGQERVDAVLDKTHVLQAIEVADLFIERETSRSSSLRHSVKRANHAMVALDAHGTIVEINELARDAFSIGDKPSTFVDGFSEQSRRCLRSYLYRMSNSRAAAAGRFVDLIELEREVSGRKIFVCLTPWTMDGQERCLLIQSINIRWPDHLTPLLRQAFGLTPSETEVFRLLSEGLSVADTATQRDTSIATVRTQIREIYAKTNTSSQLQFIRLAVSLAALTLDGNTQTEFEDIDNAVGVDRSFPHPEQWHMFKLPDGRDLDYAVFGARSGTPCLFFHNELICDVWPEALTAYATAQGLKIILPARPYYRRSSGYPKGVWHPEQTARDFRDLLDFLGIERCPVLAQTLGGMFALQFAHEFPERVTTLCTLAPMLPFSSEAQQSNMPALHKFVSSLVLSSPWMMDFISRVGYAYYLKGGPENYVRRTFASVPVDVETLSNPKHMRSLCRGSKFAERNGPKAYVAGFKHLIDDPIEMMRNLRVPMTVVIGDADMNTRQERAQSLIESGVSLNVVLAKNGGDLLVFTHPELIIDTLLSEHVTVNTRSDRRRTLRPKSK